MRMHRQLCYMESYCRNVSTEQTRQTNNKYTYKYWKGDLVSQYWGVKISVATNTPHSSSTCVSITGV